MTQLRKKRQRANVNFEVGMINHNSVAFVIICPHLQFNFSAQQAREETITIMAAPLLNYEKRFDADAIKRLLPLGSSLVVDDVPWDEYEEFLIDVGDSPFVRVFYDRGRMEIMSPAQRHERCKTTIHELLMAIAYELGILMTCFASTTLRREAVERGAKPDDSFYIQNAARAIANQDENLDLEKEPPPDLVIEVDRTSSSLNKFTIYAALGVPEFWRIIGKRVRFYLLRDGRYEESEKSGAFPFLTTETLAVFLEQGIEEGEMAAAMAFRKWLNINRQNISF
jgi:Uma2 family endonuclease